ncbi:MAG: sugar transferase, partial [Oscillospiraceae bacterium]|nr:sugar transferase [Oscillospiraceae bacterium]
MSDKLFLTEDDVTKVTLESFKNQQEGVTEYPILEFDNNALDLLALGVHETLQYSNIKPAGGKLYLFFKRLFDILVSAIALF